MLASSGMTMADLNVCLFSESMSDRGVGAA